MSSLSSISSNDPSRMVNCFDADLKPEAYEKLGLPKNITDNIGKWSSGGGGQLYESLDGKHFIQLGTGGKAFLPEGYKLAAFSKVYDLIKKNINPKELEKMNRDLPLPSSQGKYRVLENIFNSAIAQEQQDTKDLYKVMHPMRFSRLKNAQEFSSYIMYKLPAE